MQIIVVGKRKAAGTSLLTGLQAFWKLSDEIDAGPNSYDLTENGTISYVTGKIGNAFDCDGTNANYLSQSTDFSWAAGGTNSLSFWFNGDAFQTNNQRGHAVGYVTAESIADWCLIVNDDTLIVNHWLSAGNDSDGGHKFDKTFSTGTWYHVVVTHNNGTLKCYIDNSLETEDASLETDEFITANRGFCLGGLRSGDVNFNGKLDAVGLWDKELTSGEVSQLYNSGSGLEHP